MTLLVLGGLLIAALLELLVVVLVSDAIGALPTVGLLLLSSIAGTTVLRRGAPMAWRRVAEASRAGERVGRQALDGGLIVVGGLLLLVPGLISGVLGGLLLLPPVRAVVRPALGFLVLRRVSLPVVASTRGAGWAASRVRVYRAGPRRESDLEGDVHDAAPDPSVEVDDHATIEARFDDPAGGDHGVR